MAKVVGEVPCALPRPKRRPFEMPWSGSPRHFYSFRQHCNNPHPSFFFLIWGQQDGRPQWGAGHAPNDRKTVEPRHLVSETLRLWSRREPIALPSPLSTNGTVTI